MDEELKIDVKEDIRAAIITANISPDKPSETLNENFVWVDFTHNFIVKLPVISD